MPLVKYSFSETLAAIWEGGLDMTTRAQPPAGNPGMLHMNLSYSGDAMRSSVSWCRTRASDEDSLNTRQHKHTVHELHYVCEGALRFDFSSAFPDVTCQAGEYIFIPAGIAHTIEDLAGFTKKLVIGFEIHSRSAAINETFNEVRAPMALRETPTFHALADALMLKSQATNVISSVSIACIVHTLLLELVDSVGENKKTQIKRLKQSEDSYRVNQIVTFITENVFNNITIGDVADALGLGVRQTSRVVQRLFGCSVNQLIVQTRLKEICALLTDSKYSIADIAEIAGFATPYSFSRHFSHYTGVTPSAYRKNYEIHRP